MVWSMLRALRRALAAGAPSAALPGALLGATVLAAVLAATAARSQPVTDLAPFVWDPARPEVLRLDGDIDRRTPNLFGSALQRFPGVQVLELSSLGGDAYAAMAMVPTIRAAGLATRIAPGGKCHSACSFLYFAGSPRAAAGELGVHQLASGNEASGHFIMNDVLDLFADLAIPDDVRRRMMQTPPTEMYVFSDAELAALGLIGPAAWSALPAGAPQHHTATVDAPAPVSPDGAAGPRPQALARPGSGLVDRDPETPTRVVVKSGGGGDFKTIQDALAAAGEGARIEIHPGTYAGGVAVIRPVDIVGVGMRWQIVIATDRDDVIDWAAAHGSLSGVTLQYTGTPSDDEHVALRIRNGSPDIRENTLTSSGGAAIAVHGETTAPTITDNEIRNSLGPGIHVLGLARGTIAQNRIYGNAPPGVFVETTPGPIVLENDIKNADRVENERAGLLLDEGKGGVELVDVDPAGPAWVSGLRPGDVVVLADGGWAHSAARLSLSIDEVFKTGRGGIDLQIRRAGQSFEMTLRQQ